jgi:hypothetical protein
MMDAVVASSKRDVERIRARGGDMVWVRPPSDGPVLANERLRVPRDQVWDRLLRETHCFGVYFEDYPEMRGLEVPEWPHLSRQSATKFTTAYVMVLSNHVARQSKNSASDDCP